jgi:hypothetical protein
VISSTRFFGGFGLVIAAAAAAILAQVLTGEPGSVIGASFI